VYWLARNSPAHWLDQIVPQLAAGPPALAGLSLPFALPRGTSLGQVR